MLRMFRNQPDLSHVKGLDVAESWTKDPVKLKSTLLLKAIPVGIPLAWYPPDGPGRALLSASGSYLG